MQIKNSNLSIYVVGAFLSILCSIVTMYNALPNNDGLYYIASAQAYLNSTPHEAMQYYHWPLYPLLIAVTSTIFATPVLTSAYIVNALLQIAIVFGFINLFKTLNPTKTQLWLALLALIIFPQFNEYRHYIIRDFGFWAFNLFAVTQLIYFYNLEHTPVNLIKNYAHISLYCGYFFISFLFRQEAVILFLLIPFCILFLDYPRSVKKQKLTALFKPFCYLIALCSISLIIYSLIFKPLNLHILHENLHFDLLAEIHTTYKNKIAVLNTQIFPVTQNNSFANFAFFIFGLIPIFITKFCIVLSFFNLGLIIVFIYLYKHKILPNNLNIQAVNNLKLISYIALITLIIPTGFLYSTFIITGRYYLFSALLLLVLTPFSLEYIWNKLSKNTFIANKYIFNSIIICIFTMIGLAGIKISNPKVYLKDSGLWFKAQNLPSDLTLTNNPQIGYYANLNLKNTKKFNINDLDDLNATCFEYKYFLINVKHNEADQISKLTALKNNKFYSVLNTFKNKKNDVVVILQRSLEPRQKCFLPHPTANTHALVGLELDS